MQEEYFATGKSHMPPLASQVPTTTSFLLDPAGSSNKSSPIISRGLNYVLIARLDGSHSLSG